MAKTSEIKEPSIEGLVALRSAVSTASTSTAAGPPVLRPRRLGADCDYDVELRRLQFELVKLQEWVRYKGLKVSGKGATIKRTMDSLNPRICRVVALGVPTQREKPSGPSSVTLHICPPPARPVRPKLVQPR